MEADARRLSGELVDAIRKNASYEQAEALLNQGADPMMVPYSDGSMILFLERVPRTSLDWACFLGRCDLFPLLLDHISAQLDVEQQNKLVEMATFSNDVNTLEAVLQTFRSTCSCGKAYAYAVNQGFVEQIRLLDSYNAFQDVKTWYRLASSFRNFELNYTYMATRPYFDTGDDFYTFIFQMPGIENVLRDAGKFPAMPDARKDSIRVMVEDGIIDETVYRHFAIRALIFDEIRLLEFLDEVTGFNFNEVFSDKTQEQIELWIRPRMSKLKVEKIASMLPEDFRFPFNPEYLTSQQDVKAILPYCSKETCEHPKYLVEFLITYSMANELAMVADWGGITKDNIDQLIKDAQKRFNTKVTAFLMEYKETHFKNDAMGSLLDAANAL